MVEFCGWKGRIFLRHSLQCSLVVKFNTLDNSLTEIGPDLGEGQCKWMCGVRSFTGSIYCAPYYSNHILKKINTNDGTVETLDDVELPETGSYVWALGGRK